MGNRGGCFHDERQELTSSRWKGRRWIACLLEFRGRWRPVMQPHRYTELFFLDEATALAAGNRPCAQCRWEDFQRFKTAWLEGNLSAHVAARDSIDLIDLQLHRERVDRRGRKIHYQANLAELPDGVIVRTEDEPERAYLVLGDRLFPWSLDGYGAPVPRADMQVDVLTPESIVRAIAAGYSPALHDSLLKSAGRWRE
jgi:hypothetical protein